MNQSNIQVLKNILYFTASLFLFLSGMLTYGFILNTRELTLEEEMQKKGFNELSNISIIVDRRNYKLIVYSDSVMIKKYRACFGRNNSIIKTSKDDLVTPRGEYRICSIDNNNYYYKSFKLDFPNEKDAAESFKNNNISYNEYIKILQALENGDCPPAGTKLGANISIHGIGKYDLIFRNLPFVFNWTNGSVALSNRNIEEISKVIRVGTRVTIIN